MRNPNQSRREFLLHASALGVCAVLPLKTTLAQNRKVDRVGLQLYTLRQEMAADFEGTLKKVAELGYKAVSYTHLTLPTKG